MDLVLLQFKYLELPSDHDTTIYKNQQWNGLKFTNVNLI